MRVYKYTKFGRDFPKKAKMSPDSFVQLAMQLAYYKIYKRLVATYESASLRRFRQGRVDNIRANSGDALAWVKAMSPESNITNEEKFRLFKKAVQYQTDLMIDVIYLFDFYLILKYKNLNEFKNILGKGMDCHLLALKQIAIESGMQPPELFADETYALSNHFALSTSQVPTSMEGSLICYGAVVPDGYGCSYNPKPDYILFVISAFKSCPTTDTKLFAQSLESSLDEMGSLCAEFIN